MIEGYFFYPGTKYGGQNPLTIHKIYAALTPSDSRSLNVPGLPSLLPPLAAAKHEEDYKILCQNTYSRSSNVSDLIKERVFI